MPYRRAHWWLASLFPLIALAFWPGYFSRLGTAPFAFHAHGLTTTAWLMLLTLQSWSIHARRPAWHRAAGLATFAIVPLFAAAAPLVLQSMATLWRDQADPFHAAYGARLVIVDMIGGPVLVGLVAYAFVQRRRVRLHAAAMLATAVLVLPPIIGRLFPALPGFPHGGAAGFVGFRLAFQLSQGVTLLIALWLAARAPDGRVAFGAVAAASVAAMIGFETIGTTQAWTRSVAALADLPPLAMAAATGGATAALLWWAWRRGAAPRRPQPRTAPPLAARA